MQRQRQNVHELLAELLPGGLIDVGALLRERGAEFGGNAAQPAGEVTEVRSGGRPDVEPAIKGFARKLDPELTRFDVAAQTVGFVRII